MFRDLIKLVSIGLALFLAGFVLKSAGVAELSTASAADKQHLTFTTTDGLILHAWLSPAVKDSSEAGTRSGLALLLPMMSHTHASYEPIIKSLNEVNYTTLAFDMRGHGHSVLIENDTLSAGKMSRGHFVRMPDDIREFFIDFRGEHPHDYNYEDVVVIGASIGANTAGLLLPERWLKRAVLLSPGRDYYGLEPETKMTGDKNPDKPVYIAVSTEDTYAAESSQWLFDHYRGPKILKKYPGSWHGTSIFENVADADRELISWLRPKK